MSRLGLGYRQELAAWLDSCPDGVDCIEITAEHFFGNDKKLTELKHKYPIMVHGLGISLGTPGPMARDYLDKFVGVCDAANADWVSEHIAFTRTAEIDLGHLNPIPYTRETLEYFAEHALELKSACQKPLILENITSHLSQIGDIPETEFINRLCEKTDCGLLLDVTNLYVNSRNHGYDALEWLRKIESEHIKQLHIVGFTYYDGNWYDSHSNAIQSELYELTREVIAYSGVDTIILERDRDFPAPQELQCELDQLRRCYEN